jgi:hypothetical protein
MAAADMAMVGWWWWNIIILKSYVFYSCDSHVLGLSCVFGPHANTMFNVGTRNP